MKNKRIIAAILIAALIFIWGNSMLSKKNSKALSDGVHEGITWLFDEENSRGMSPALIRKAAHFAEFAVLGGAAALLLRDKRKGFLKAFLLSAAAAAADETIQIFSNRGSSFSDVLLDSCGAAFGILAVFLILKIFEKLRG